MTYKDVTPKKKVVYPYIPNSVPEIKKQMLEEIGAQSVEELFEEVPERLRFRGQLNLPAPCLSEYALMRHVEKILAKNKSCKEYLSFRGAGCYQHHVPAICDEVNQRGEFLTAYAGEPYDDHGRFQALFESASMMGELLDMDAVNVPTYDGYQAAATAIRMAARITGRTEVLIPRTINPDKLSKIKDYCKPDLHIKGVDYHPDTGQVDMKALRALMSGRVAAVYFENPVFLGFIETQGWEIADVAHQHGAQCIVGVDPITLGVLSPPSHYGADIVCGDLQPLGIHMNYGGGHSGFIATRDEEKYVMEYPSRLFGIAPTRVEGEYGFGDVAYERTSFAVREEGKEWVGTASALWGITAGVYLALMGPQGMQDIGRGMMERTAYAIKRFAELPGVRCPFFEAPHFKEFVVDFSATGRTLKDINRALMAQEIFGGLDLTSRFPALGGSSLWCVTEVHTKENIDRAARVMEEVLK
jgi:glycine dehydrogenase subunit 1